MDRRNRYAWNLPHRQRAVLVLALLLLLLILPASAWADAPINRGPDSLPQGSTGTASAASGTMASDNVPAWRGIQMLPPPSTPARGSVMFPQSQAGGGNSAIAWLGRELNPGNWILDAGMGILAGVIKTFTGLLQKATATLISGVPIELNAQSTSAALQPLDAGWSVVPSGCFDSATNIVFCVPTNLTYDHPGIQTVWAVLRSIAASLVTILFVIRIGRLISEGPRSLATEGKGMLLTFLLAMIFIQSTQAICAMIIDFFNGLNSLLLRNASLALPAVDVGDLNIGSNLMFLFFWIIILVLTLKSFLRLARLIVLLAVAPLAGALLMDRATSGRFGAWFGKLIESLLEQTSLVIVFVVAAAIVQPYVGRSGGDAFVQILLAIVVLLMALGGPSLIGLAAGASAGGFVASMVSYTALRRVGGRVLTRGGGGGRSLPTREMARATDQRATVASGDPARSAAALRQRSTSSGSTSGPARPAPMGSFRMADSSDGVRAERAHTRYQMANDIPRAVDGQRSPTARRQQALMRGTLMRQRADALRAQGDTVGAGPLARKARLQTRFGRGQDIARPPRFTVAQRATRMQTYRAALAEVQGLHGIERDALTQQIALDEACLPELQRNLAISGTSGGDASALHHEHTAIEQRLSTNRARMQALTPQKGMAHARATREAATALANERLPHALRSRRFAERHSADRASPFVRRIVQRPTQGARDELARSRMAQNAQARVVSTAVLKGSVLSQERLSQQ